jgi:uncharacterized membrane protein YhaH (DUF805 family)
MNWYIEVLKKYAVFSGRARRKEYWFFALFNVIIIFVLTVIDMSAGLYDVVADIGLLSGLYSLAVLLPSIAVTVRRLHDIDRTGWWLLIVFIPVIGVIVLLVFAVLESTPGSNRYGPNPHELPASTGNQTPNSRYLLDDSYKISLVKKYGIERNEALGQFICNDRLFPTIEDALSFADSVEQMKAQRVDVPSRTTDKEADGALGNVDQEQSSHIEEEPLVSIQEIESVIAALKEHKNFVSKTDSGAWKVYRSDGSVFILQNDDALKDLAREILRK